MIINVKQKFLEKFTQLGYHYFNDESILPQNGNLNDDCKQESLFVGAGVYKFKDYFTNKLKSDKDYVSIQPCIRLDDIDLVGDETHLTSFLMGGIFSFGFHPQHEILYNIFEFIYNLIPNVTIHDFIITIHPSLSYLVNVWKGYDINLKTRFEESNEWNAPGIKGYSTEIMLLNNEKVEIELGNIVLVPMQDGQIFYDVGLGIERISSVCNNFNLGEEKKYFEILKTKFSVDSNNFRKLNDYLHTIDLIVKEDIKPSNKRHGYVLRNLIRRCLVIFFKTKISYNFLQDMILLCFQEEEKKINNIIKEAKKYLEAQKIKNEKIDYEYMSTTIGCSKEMLECYFNIYI